MKQLNEKATQMLKDVDNTYSLALLKIPKTVRQMNWIEVFSKSRQCCLSYSSFHTYLSNNAFFGLSLISI